MNVIGAILIILAVAWAIDTWLHKHSLERAIRSDSESLIREIEEELFRH